MKRYTRENDPAGVLSVKKQMVHLVEKQCSNGDVNVEEEEEDADMNSNIKGVKKSSGSSSSKNTNNRDINKLNTLFPNWGDDIKLLLHPVIEAEDFWALYDEHSTDTNNDANTSAAAFNSNCIRTTLLEAFRDGHLYSLRTHETDAMYTQHASSCDLFVHTGIHTTLYMMPIFCIIDPGTSSDSKPKLYEAAVEAQAEVEVDAEADVEVVLIWTHSRARNLGLASKLMQLLHVTKAFHPNADSIGFFHAIGIKS
jgi:hypothetical protein